MTAPDWTNAETPAEILQGLARHRLLPVAALLSQRGLLRSDLVQLAEQFSIKTRPEMERRREVEAEIMKAIECARVPCLVLKGALVGRTVYAGFDQRQRLDIDLLVDRTQVREAEVALRRIGFSPALESYGGAPKTQAQWVRRSDETGHSADLHWDLFDRPLLKNRFQFNSLWGRSILLMGEGRYVRGLGTEDALLHACAHYFAHHRDEFRPDLWLLDIDLLWSELDWPARQQLADLAISLGIGSLLFEALNLCKERFETLVELEWQRELGLRARDEAAARFTRQRRRRALEVFQGALEERGVRAKLENLRGMFFPPAAYMHRKYPEAGRWTLPWLYLRRIIEGRKK